MTDEERAKRIRAQMEAMRPMTKEEMDAKNLREAPLARNTYGDPMTAEQARGMMQDPLQSAWLRGAWNNVSIFDDEPPSLWTRFKRWIKNPTGAQR